MRNINDANRSKTVIKYGKSVRLVYVKVTSDYTFMKYTSSNRRDTIKFIGEKKLEKGREEKDNKKYVFDRESLRVAGKGKRMKRKLRSE